MQRQNTEKIDELINNYKEVSRALIAAGYVDFFERKLMDEKEE